MNRKNIIILISLISALVLVFVFLDPLWSSIKALQNEINQQKLALTATEEILAKTQELDQEYQPLAEQAQKVPFALPEEKDIPYLLVQFDALAASNGLLLESMSFVQIEQGKEGSYQALDQPKEISPFPSLSLSVKVSGSYDAFKGYLTNLENSVRSMDVHSIQFAVLKEGLAALGIFEFDLGVIIYYHDGKTFLEDIIKKIDFDIDFLKEPYFQALKIHGEWPLSIEEKSRPNPFLPY